MSLHAIIILCFLAVMPGEGLALKRPYSEKDVQEMKEREELVKNLDAQQDEPDKPVKFRQVSQDEEAEETQEQLIADVMPKADGNKVPAAAYEPKDEELKRLDHALNYFKQKTGVDLTGAPMVLEKMVHPALDMAKQAARATSGFVDITPANDDKTDEE